jgi:vitellogenic carboxypeptidase-like protein
MFQSWNNDLDIFMVKSEFWNLYNLLYEVEPEVGGDLYNFVQLPEVRRALHVGDQVFSGGGTVYQLMIPDFMNSVRPWLEEVIENYRVLYYSGQMDIIVAYPLTVGLFNTLEFRAAEEYREAERIPWYVEGRLAGYMKSGGNFTEVLVRNAGHMVPTDQPVWAFDLINRFTKDDLLPRHN